MASISREPNGRRTIQFVAPDKRRRSIRLGKMSQRNADAVKVKIEDLVASAITGHAPHNETSRWLKTLDDSLREKIVAVGLARPRGKATLAAFISEYLTTQQVTVKPTTVTTWRQCERLLLEYFDHKRPLKTITEGDAVEFRAFLLTRGLAEATVRRRCGCAKTFFKHAVRHDLIESNPFESDAVPTAPPKSAQKSFIKPETAIDIMNALPNAQWRLLFALARWGGLRVPSEPQLLRWTDVDWERNRLIVQSPKTEHHVGHESRELPIFPELLGPLRDVFEQAKDGEQFVLPFLQNRSGASLRKPLLKAIETAKVTTWDKLWTTLRATRDTELRESFPSHVVAKWIGHDDRVAERHYLQITDAHFEKAVQNPVQCSAVSARIGSHGQNENHKEKTQNDSVQIDANLCDNRELQQVGPEGLEPS